MCSSDLVFDHEAGPARDIVALNAGAALYVCGLCEDFAEGYARAGELIASGAARERFAQYVRFSKSLAENEQK